MMLVSNDKDKQNHPFCIRCIIDHKHTQRGNGGVIVGRAVASGTRDLAIDNYFLLQLSITILWTEKVNIGNILGKVRGQTEETHLMLVGIII